MEFFYNIFLGMDFIFKIRARLDYGNFKIKLQFRENFRVIINIFNYFSVVSAKLINLIYADDLLLNEKNKKDDKKDGDYARLIYLNKAFDAIKVLYNLSKLDIVKNEGKI